MQNDYVEDFHQAISKIRHEGKTFAIATIIQVEGSASARTGSKAIFDEQGQNLQGWVGGGCAERFIGEQVVESLKENKTRIVTADMDDEILGLGVACGGKMHIFIDPVLPLENIPVPSMPKMSKEIQVLARGYGWHVVPSADSSQAFVDSPEDLFLQLSAAVAKKRKSSALSMRKYASGFSGEKRPHRRQVCIVGRSRITEALARHFALLGDKVRVVAPTLRKEDYPSTIECSCLNDSYQEAEFQKDEAVIVASHTAQDPALVKKALDAGVAYIAMVGSQKRAVEVMNFLNWSEDQMAQSPVFVPAGLDIAARNPEEIALSIVSECIQERKAAT